MDFYILLSIFRTLWTVFQMWERMRKQEREKALVQTLQKLDQRLLSLEEKIKALKP